MNDLEKHLEDAMHQQEKDAELDAIIKREFELVALNDERHTGVGASINDPRQPGLQKYRVVKSEGGKGDDEKLIIVQDDDFLERLRKAGGDKLTLINQVMLSGRFRRVTRRELFIGGTNEN